MNFVQLARAMKKIPISSLRRFGSWRPVTTLTAWQRVVKGDSMRLAHFRLGRAPLGIAVALLGAGLVGQGRADTTPTLNEVQVGPEGRIGEPWIALNPANTGMVVAALSVPCGDGGHTYWSTNASQWTKSAITGIGIPCPGQTIDPSAAFSANGHVFVSRLDAQFPATSSGMDSVALIKSTDGGQSFDHLSYALEPGMTVRMPNGNLSSLCSGEETFADWSKMTADASPNSPFSDHLYIAAVVGVEDGICRSYTVVVRSIDGGNTWTNATAFDRNDIGVLEENISTGPVGTLYFATRSWAIGGVVACPFRDIVVSRSMDGGVSYVTSCIPNPDPVLTPRYIVVAIDPLDPARVYVAFALGSGFGNSIYVARTIDGGVTWLPSVEVYRGDDDVAVRRGSLSVSSTGRVDLAWPDNRNQPGQSANLDVYYSYSTDHGQTFQPSIRVTPVTAKMFAPARNDYMTIASRGTEAYIAYAQDRMIPTSNWHEVFVTTVTHSQ